MLKEVRLYFIDFIGWSVGLFFLENGILKKINIEGNIYKY